MFYTICSSIKYIYIVKENWKFFCLTCMLCNERIEYEVGENLRFKEGCKTTEVNSIEHKFVALL